MVESFLKLMKVFTASMKHESYAPELSMAEAAYPRGLPSAEEIAPKVVLLPLGRNP